MINHGTGKRGKDMIPNSKFWSDLPGLIAVSPGIWDSITVVLNWIPKVVHVCFDSSLFLAYGNEPVMFYYGNLVKTNSR